MKKALMFIALSTVTVNTTTAQEITRSFSSREAQEKFEAQLGEQFREIEEAMENGKDDDALLKEALARLAQFYCLEVSGYPDAEFYQKVGITAERIVKIMENMIREKVSAIENDKAGSVSWRISELMPMFKAFPDYDTSPIIEECLKSKAEIVRKYAEALKEAKQREKKGNTNEEESNPKGQTKEESKTPPQTTGATESAVPPQPPGIAPNAMQGTIRDIPPAEQPEETSASKNTVLVVALAAVLALGGGVIAWIKKHGKRK